MSKEIARTPAVRPLEEPLEVILDQSDLPDRWCFGLAHPYIQRLIFLARTLERRVASELDNLP